MHDATAPRWTPTRVIGLWVVAAVTFLAIDAVWLTLMAERLYRPSIGHLMRPDFDPVAAGLFYLLYVTGVLVLAILPSRSVSGAAGRGALFGLVAYGTYDLTNQATLRDWPWHVTLADLCWGSLLTAVACAVARAVVRPAARIG